MRRFDRFVSLLCFFPTIILQFKSSLYVRKISGATLFAWLVINSQLSTSRCYHIEIRLNWIISLFTERFYTEVDEIGSKEVIKSSFCTVRSPYNAHIFWRSFWKSLYISPVGSITHDLWQKSFYKMHYKVIQLYRKSLCQVQQRSKTLSNFDQIASVTYFYALVITIMVT